MWPKFLDFDSKWANDEALVSYEDMFLAVNACSRVAVGVLLASNTRSTIIGV